MSFFQQQGNDSNLQYDDAAFIFFIASTFVISAIILFVLIIKHLNKFKVHNQKKILEASFLNKKLANLKSYKRRKWMNKSLLYKIVAFVVLIIAICYIYDNTKDLKGNLKGFDPYQILGLKQGATLPQIKKAYRQLARQHHPDKNNGNPQSQSKFILISKSYECFTNQKKRENCFKFGNPDGASTFRVGIGLPAIFIKIQYQWVVLPIILLLFLVIIPILAFKWSTRQFVKDQNGISMLSMDKLFKCIDKDCNKFSILALLSSFKQMYQYLGYGPISTQNKDKLFSELNKYPQCKKSFVQDFTDQQQYIYWEIFKYMAGLGQFQHEEFRQILEEYMVLSLEIIRWFCLIQNDGGELYGNPDWRITFLGVMPLQAYGQFTRDYYNRTLAIDQNTTIWLKNLDLSPQQIQIAQKNYAAQWNLFLALQNNNYQQFVKLYPQQRQASIRSQLQNMPVYNMQAKLTIDNKQSNTLTHFDYGQISIKVSRLNKTNGYIVSNNYPFPKKQRILLVAINTYQNQDVYYQQLIQFPQDKDYYTTKFDLRSSPNAGYNFIFVAISQAYHKLDVNFIVNIPTRSPTPQQMKSCDALLGYQFRENGVQICVLRDDGSAVRSLGKYLIRK